MSLVVFNGRVVEKEKAKVSPDDRGFLLGDGLFETMRAYGGRVFRIHDHLSRLFASCEYFRLRPPWSREELAGMAQELLEKNELESARVRLTITRGRHRGAMSLQPAASPTLLITADPLSEEAFLRDEEGIRLGTAGVRFSDRNPVFRHKTLNRLPHLAARTEAEAGGFQEALILDERGNVASASTGNFFAIQNGQLFTPPLSGPVLPGITREVVISLAGRLGLPLREDFFSPIMLAGAQEAFITNSVRELVPVVEIDGLNIGSGRPGPWTARLKDLFKKEVMTE